jgi:hypothetical protein
VNVVPEIDAVKDEQSAGFAPREYPLPDALPIAGLMKVLALTTVLAPGQLIK